MLHFKNEVISREQLAGKNTTHKHYPLMVLERPILFKLLDCAQITIQQNTAQIGFWKLHMVKWMK